MKTLVILYAGDISKHLFDPVFDEKSASMLSLEWAKSVQELCSIVIFSGTKNALWYEKTLGISNLSVPYSIITKDKWSVENLLIEMSHIALDCNADTILYAWADCPFLNSQLTKELINTHKEFKAEYTYADGYPYGFAPEVLDTGTARILSQRTELFPKDEKVLRNSVFTVIKKDINSFEVETVLSPEDWRQYRLEFECGSKRGIFACSALYRTNITGKTPQELSRISIATSEILKTLPMFYNIQIQSSCSGKCIYCPYPSACKEKYGFLPDQLQTSMDLNSFKQLIQSVKNFSENAVISLSAWGEALENPLFPEYVKEIIQIKGLSVLIETTAQNVSEKNIASIAEMIKKVDDNTFPYQKIMWIVSLDAASPEKYAYVHGLQKESAKIEFEIAKNNITLLESYFPEEVYPQFIRINKNEDELEKFFRYWSEKNSPSFGSVIIQKYNDFAGFLSPEKPADLSPLERIPCWHICRDMTILYNGDVPFCTVDMLEKTAGNVFKESLETVWQRFTPLVEKHIKKDFSEKCRRCDEYYTFIF